MDTSERKPSQLPTPPDRPAALDWRFDPGVPTRDFLGGYHLEWPWDLEEAVAKFIQAVELGEFLAWEATLCAERRLPVTAAQRAGQERWTRFQDAARDDDDSGRREALPKERLPRPSEPWHVILNKIVPHLLVEPFQTWEDYDDVKLDGWFNLAKCLEEHGSGLSLPDGVDSVASSPVDVVPAELRHKLWLQSCFVELAGLGQELDMTLQNPNEHFRVQRFAQRLPRCRESVLFFDLTIETLLSRLILPEDDRPIFVRMLQAKLGIKSPADRLADYL
jgi:hypothetical protein